MASPEQEPGPKSQQINDLFDALETSKAVGPEEFKLFIEHVPIALIVSKLVHGDQRIVFANKAYEYLTGQALADICGRGWSVLDAFRLEEEPQLTFSQVLPKCDDFVGCFRRDQPKPLLVEGYAGLIENEDGTENYRIVALLDVTEREKTQREDFARRIRDRDLLLKELQHRVKNNLQLITALIRLDIRNQRKGATVALDRLAGRIESLQLLYRELSADDLGQAVDLGHYVSQIATAATHTYAVDGIRLDLKVDHAPVSVNIAMPIGLLVNELLTNAFKYAFTSSSSGILTVRCLHEQEDRYQIVVGDNGIGLPEGLAWPVRGKLSALMLQTLRENVNADFHIESAPGKGTRVTIGFIHKSRVGKPN